jgi:hypothetical protein
VLRIGTSISCSYYTLGNILKTESKTSAEIILFEQELEAVKGRIRFLNEQPYDDETDARIAQNEIWDLEPIVAYLEKRIADLA